MVRQRLRVVQRKLFDQLDSLPFAYGQATKIDVERLLAEALTKHGIRLDQHDPAIVLVTLNRLVLEDAAEYYVADIRKATREYEEAANQV